MLIDFSPLANREVSALEFARQFTLADLRAATHSYIDAMHAIIQDASDAEVVFQPLDPDAHDPFAVAGEEKLAWNLGHLVAHVTASSEEGAAFSALLAQGVQLHDESLRLRYETPWREMTTVAKARQRLEESRRIRLAYLAAWPDAPHLDVFRPRSARFVQRFGQMNAPAAYLFGLWHEDGHLAQMREVRRQAREASGAATGR